MWAYNERMSRTHEHDRAPSREATVAMGTLAGQGLPLPSVAGGRAVDQSAQGIEATRAAAIARADQERARTDQQRDPSKAASVPAVGELNQAQTSSVQQGLGQAAQYRNHQESRLAAALGGNTAGLNINEMSVQDINQALKEVSTASVSHARPAAPQHVAPADLFDYTAQMAAILPTVERGGQSIAMQS